MKRWIAVGAVVTLAALWLVVRPNPTPEPELTVPQLLDQAISEIIDAESLQFRIDRDGVLPVVQGFEIRSMQGVFVTPERTSAELRIKAGPLFLLSHIVGIGPDTWLQDPLTNTWTQLPADQSIAIGPFLSAEGLPLVLSNDFTNVELIQEFEIQDLPGEIVLQISGQLNTTRLNTMTQGLMEAGTFLTHVYITPDGHLRRIEINDSNGMWIVDVWDLNNPEAVVEPPV